MWNLIRTVLIALALIGFIGQTTARATSVDVFVSADAAMADMDCAQMMGMAVHHRGAPSDCSKGMTSDCMAKMGCTAVAAPLPAGLYIPKPTVRRAMTYVRVDASLEGAGPPPLVFPPKQQA